VRGDGEVRWLDDFTVAVRDERGRVTHYEGYVLDVSERRGAEAALRRAERKYRAIFENSLEGIFQSTPEGRFLTVNPALARMLGYETPEALVAGTADIAGQLYAAPERRLEFKRALSERGSIQGFVNRVYRKDGGSIWISVNARAVRGTDGAILYYEGTAQDVSEQKRAEEARAELRTAVEKAAVEWERTFDSMEAPILIVDAQARVVRLNRAARELAGADAREPLGRPLAELARGEPWRTAGELARRVHAGGAPAQTELHDPASGRSFELSAAPSPAPSGGGSHVIVVARDVTRMIQLQGSLRRSETMSAMGMLVAGVAHEVRNPLFSISANLDAFEARLGSRAEFSRFVEQMRLEVDRLAALMEGLLEYGKPMISTLQPGSLEGVVREAVERSNGLAKRNGVALSVGEACAADVLMDRKRMVQVVQNLLQNAIQHSPQGGRVSVGLARDDGGRGRWLALAVSDQGPGFHSEDLQRVFEPFFSRRRGGTGLGLAIVQRIVEEHGGSIAAGNRPVGGAQVTVRLPCVAQPD
jgi:PAS domain S-box-containing protein